MKRCRFALGVSFCSIENKKCMDEECFARPNHFILELLSALMRIVISLQSHDENDRRFTNRVRLQICPRRTISWEETDPKIYTNVGIEKKRKSRVLPGNLKDQPTLTRVVPSTPQGKYLYFYYGCNPFKVGLLFLSIFRSYRWERG